MGVLKEKKEGMIFEKLHVLLVMGISGHVSNWRAEWTG